MQLVAYGAQDIYLTGNPQITFFKVVYRRHTNFSMETIQQTINGASTLSGSTSNGTVTISRNGDLVSSVYVTSSTGGILNSDNLIQEVELEIGGQKIDKQTKEWMQIWEELTIPNGEKPYFKHMKHAYTPNSLVRRENLTSTDGHDTVGMVQLPLYFWFCRNPGLALPLIALQYHEVKLKFTWGISTGLGHTSDGDPTQTVAGKVACQAAVKVWVDYIYLDTDERRRFAQVSHEYLIEQIQESSHTGAASLKLNFNHPVKELLWTDTANTSYTDARLVLNGHDRFAAQEEEYFQLRQPYEYHTAIPSLNCQKLSFDQTDHFVFIADTSGADGDNEYDSDANNNLKLYLRKGWYPQINDYIKIEHFVDGEFLEPVFVTISDVTASKSGLNSGYHLHTPNGTPAESRHNYFVITTTDDWNSATIQDGDIIQIHVLERRGRPSIVNTLRHQINCYSFALKPEEHQPSGTCNFSRIDNAKLIFSTAPAGTVKVFAVNYNVLRIMSGMGGLAYSN